MSDERLMPGRLELGRYMNAVLSLPLTRYNEWVDDGRPDDPHGRRLVMGYPLPTWQRPIVTDEPWRIRLLESLWRGLSIGTFTYNEPRNGFSVFDGLLVDGQQRMAAIQAYIEDEFPVFGYRWSELPPADKREFKNARHFPCYILDTEDEGFLRDFYNLTNFSANPHTDAQRA